ncbi:hypothetical protein [Acinetobacter sp. YH1901141]|uniref:hypothetical protein n=1 Tax=Acinetobacter sp. YH1901141 TaxID=2601201 RepID=UPI0015D1258C|nr:hypothetical protein [Acinetobacter sp. YH1901141]
MIKKAASQQLFFLAYWVTLNLADTPDPSVVPKVYLDARASLPLLIAITGEALITAVTVTVSPFKLKLLS